MAEDFVLGPVAEDDEIASKTSLSEIRVDVSDQGETWEMVVSIREGFAHADIKICQSLAEAKAGDGEELKMLNKTRLGGPDGEVWKMYMWNVPKAGAKEQVLTIERVDPVEGKARLVVISTEWIDWYFAPRPAPFCGPLRSRGS